MKYCRVIKSNFLDKWILWPKNCSNLNAEWSRKKSKNLLFLWLITQIIVTMIAYKTREIILTDHYGNRSLCLNTFECISKVEPHCLFTSDSYKIRKGQNYSESHCTLSLHKLPCSELYKVYKSEFCLYCSFCCTGSME